MTAVRLLVSSDAEAEAALAASKEKLKAAVRKGRSLEKERDRLHADLAGTLAPQVTSFHLQALSTRTAQVSVE
jgi:3-hydroxyacyl-CoA dehydrogenase